MQKITPVCSLLLLALTGCSPLCRLELRFAFGGPLDPALFQLSGRSSCPPGPVGSPPPLSPLAPSTASSSDLVSQEVSVEAPGLRVVTGFRGVRCRVRVTGFYDTNRDGVVNRGDLSATSPDIEVEDRGLFRGNLNAGPVLRFSPIP
jgi:hypothetical protein